MKADWTGGTIGCALAPSMAAILVARGIAGAGSGGLLTVTVRSDAFPLHNVPRSIIPIYLD